MSDSRRSFWSTVPGLVTGLAGLLTGIVGLVTVFIQLGILGGKDSGDKAPAGGNSGAVTTTVAGAGAPATGLGGVAGATTTTDVPTFTVSPLTLDFKPQDPKVQPVTITNTSASAMLRVPLPDVSGPDGDRFTAKFGTCTDTPLRPRDSCTVNVTFTPSGALRTYTASLQVSPTGLPVGKEVALKASTLL